MLIVHERNKLSTLNNFPISASLIVTGVELGVQRSVETGGGDKTEKAVMRAMLSPCDDDSIFMVRCNKFTT